MNLAELRADLEEDLAWRMDEIRHLRNALLSEFERDAWPVSAMRVLLVMQYAHLEGFTQNALTTYVRAINQCAHDCGALKPELMVAALVQEFKSLRTGDSAIQDSSESERLMRRAKREFAMVSHVRGMMSGRLVIDPDRAVSLEMNLGSEVLKKNFFILGIPDESLERNTYTSLDFVRRNRNDVAHGKKTMNIEPAKFEAHSQKCEEYMRKMVLVITRAATEEWYLDAARATG